MFKRFGTMYSSIFSRTNLDFGPGEFERDLTLTFNFLRGLVSLLVVLTAFWSVSAGISQSGRLTTRLAATFTSGSQPWQNFALAVGPVIGAVCYTLRAFAVAMLLCLTAGCAGAILGFLFGVPRPSSQAGDTKPAPPVPQGGGMTGLPAASSSWQASTNLTEISDWLTKIIVGVGLVEVKSLTQRVADLSHYVGSQLFGGLASAGLVLPALMVAGVILGFIFSFLFTQLVLANLIVQSARDVAGQLHDVAVLAEMRPTSPALAPNLLREGLAGPPMPQGGGAPKEPSSPQRRAAENIQSLPLERIEDPAMIRVWARAQALLNQYGPATLGYAKLLQKRRTPGILAEAARVFAANKDMAKARQLLDEAVAERDHASPDTRASITFDAANLALYDPAPAGFNRALQLLDDETLKTDSSGTLYVLRACANGQRLKFRREELTEDAKKQLREQIVGDLKHSLTVNKSLLDWVRYLIDPEYPGKKAAGEDRDDDLVGILSPDELKSILAVADADDPAPGGT